MSAVMGCADVLLSRLDRVKRTGKGWIACCPAHTDKSASLSVIEADDGKVLLHCFAGCNSLDVVQSVGLSLADLFPQRLAPQTDAERRAMRQAARESRWAAALGVLAREATVVLIAARMLATGQRLETDDGKRLARAVSLIEMAQGMFHVG